MSEAPPLSGLSGRGAVVLSSPATFWSTWPRPSDRAMRALPAVMDGSGCGIVATGSGHG
jgi:hypothetical protein